MYPCFHKVKIAQDDIGSVVRRLTDDSHRGPDAHARSLDELKQLLALAGLPEQVRSAVSDIVYNGLVKPAYISNLRAEAAKASWLMRYNVVGASVCAVVAVAGATVVAAGEVSFSELNRYNLLYFSGGMMSIGASLSVLRVAFNCRYSRALKKEIRAVEESQHAPQQPVFPELYPLSL